MKKIFDEVDKSNLTIEEFFTIYSTVCQESIEMT